MTRFLSRRSHVSVRITLKVSAGDYPYSRGRPAPIPTRSRGDSGGAGRVPVQGRARPGHLRGQGEVAATAAEPVLRRLHPAPPAHSGDADDRRKRRLDGREDRGRGAATGVLLDQGVRPPVQREVPRRQELPLPRGHHGRGVPAGHGDARREKKGHQVLRPVQPRLGDPRHGGHLAARLSRPRSVTMDEEFPRVMVMRGAKRKGTRYFGPYSHAWAIRDTVDTLLRVFPVRDRSPWTRSSRGSW